MAEIKSFPNNQDEYIGAENVMKWMHGRTSGVFSAEGNALVSAVQDAMAVTVADGVGWLSNDAGDGVVWWNDKEKNDNEKLRLQIDVADGVLDRIDRVIVSWPTTNYVDRPTISVLKGTPATYPNPPSITNDLTVRQISLAKIYIAAGTISLTNAMITDERLDPNVCGLVTERVDVDTSGMNQQFISWFETVQGILGEDEAGNLLQLIEGLEESKVPITRKVNGKALSEDVVLTAADVKAVNPNLLDNWYFGNPVNQRGQTSYTETGYSIDRWKLEASVEETVTSDGLKLKPLQSGWRGIRQIFEVPKNLRGQTVTVSMLIKKNGNDFHSAIRSGSVTLNSTMVDGETDSGGWTLRCATANIPQDVSDLYTWLTFNASVPAGNEVVIKAVKAEIGDCQTLAHRDASGNWVLNEIPNYAAELTKCMRYYQRAFIMFGSDIGAPKRQALNHFLMRTVPAVTININNPGVGSSSNASVTKGLQTTYATDFSSVGWGAAFIYLSADL